MKMFALLSDITISRRGDLIDKCFHEWPPIDLKAWANRGQVDRVPGNPLKSCKRSTEAPDQQKPSI